MANSQGSVDLVIRAKDETQRAINSAKTALDRFAQAQARTAARRNFLADSRKAAEDAGKAYLEAGRAAEELGRKTQGGAAGTKKQKTAFDEARRAAVEAKKAFRETGVAYLQASGKSGSGRGSFAAFDAVASGASRAEAGLERLAATQQRVAAANDRATASAQRNGAAMQTQGGRADVASKVASAYSTRQGRGPLGLRPYELTNLGYQINDLVTQVASGTSPMQALAQQGGQIIQLFPKAAVSVLRMVPAIAAVTAVVGPMIAAFSRVSGLESDTRKFEAALTATADAATYSAEELASATQALDDMGASGDDARKMVQQFVKDGLNPVFFEDFGDAARDLAKITGQDLVEANKLLSEGLTGTYDDFKAMDDVLNVATKAERNRIRVLFESGKADEARRMAAELTFRRLDDGAKKLSGPWSRAAEGFGRAWTNLLNAVGNWAIVRGAIDLIGRLGRQLEWLTQLMGGAGQAVADARQLQSLDQDIAEKRDRRARIASSGGDPRARREAMDAIDADIERDLSEARTIGTRRGQATARRMASLTVPTERGAKEAEDRARAQRPSRSGGESEAERRAKAQAEFVDGLRAENAERVFQLSLLDETERQQRILTAIREAETEAAKVGLELTAQQRADITRTVGALYDGEQALKASETVNRALLDLAKARGEQESRNAYVARKVAEDTEGWLFAQKVAYAGLLAAQWDAEDASRQRTESEKKVNDLMQIRSDLLDQIEFYDNAGQTATADTLRVRLEEVNGELALAVDQAINFLTALGGPEAESALMNLGMIRDQLRGVGQSAVTTGKEINDMISQGGAQAFDRFAQQLVETGNLFTSLRDAFLQFAADFLRQIAQMIVKQAILNAIGGATDGGTGSGGIGGQIAGWINGIVRHQGGGTSGGAQRSVPVAAYANAFRYHGGGIAGMNPFKPGEVPAVLRAGEVVDPGDGSVFQKMFGGGRGGQQSVKVVNVLDPADMLDRALGNDEGERIFMNFVRRNSEAFKAVLG